MMYWYISQGCIKKKILEIVSIFQICFKSPINTDYQSKNKIVKLAKTNFPVRR